jgi:bifunctional DNA-binding transcriptional regulator/antitoxin component of YhaV-PrlF toxin-antitoxin module
VKRKVVELGRKTLVVSLPAEWAARNSVSKGDEVEVTETEDNILIHKPAKHERSITFTVGLFTKRQLADCYIRGYDEVRLLYEDKGFLEKLKEEDLLGYELVEEADKHCVFRNVSAIMETEFDVMLRRTFLLLKEMSSLLIEAMQGKNTLEMVKEKEKLTNKYTNYCKRLLNKNGAGWKTTFLYVITTGLEVLGDEYKFLAHDLGRTSKEEIDFFKKVHEYLENYYDMYYSSKTDFENFYSARKKLVEEGKLVGGAVGHHGLTIINQVYNLSGPLMTMRFGQR